MQLHACLLLFIITTDKSLALLRHHCGGIVRLDQRPAGLINLTLPGHLTTVDLATQRPDETPVSACTWTLGIPQGRTVLLRLAWLESGSNISARCSWNGEDHDLAGRGAALLSGCDGNKATLSWTGAGQSSNAAQLSYYVQERKRNSLEDHTSPHSDLLQTGTSFISAAPLGQEVVSGTDGGRGRLHEGLEEWRSEPQSVSSSTNQDRGLLHPTSPLWGSTVTGRADRETHPLPEEEPNNRAETSGAAHLTDAPTHAREGTRPYFQRALGTDATFHTLHSINKEASPPTRGAVMPLTLSSSTTMLDTSEPPTTTPAPLAVSSSSVRSLASSPPPLASSTASESGTTLGPRGAAGSPAPGETFLHPWRSQRSTDRLDSDLTSAVTSDPLTSQTQQQQQGDSSGAPTDTQPTEASSSQGASRIPSSSTSSTTSTTSSTTSTSTTSSSSTTTSTTSTSSTTSSTTSSSSSATSSSSSATSSTSHLTELQTAAATVEEASFRPNVNQTDFLAPVTSETPGVESLDGFENTEMLHTLVLSPQNHTSSPPPPPHTSSPFTRTSTEETRTRVHQTNPTAGPSATTKDGGWTSAAAASGLTADAQTAPLSPTLSPTALPHFSSGGSLHPSTPSQARQTHTASSVAHTSLATPSTTIESDHKAPPSQAATSAAPNQSGDPAAMTPMPTAPTPTAPTPTPSCPTTSNSDHHGQEDGSWQPFHSSTSAQTPTVEPRRPPSPWTSRTETAPAAFTSATSQAPKFYVVPDQPAAIRVESIELLLQIIVEESRSAVTSGLEEETTAWVEPYLQRAPGFSRLLGVWSSGHAVQSLVEFKTGGALQWLSMTGPASLMEQTGLAQAVREGRSFRSSKITNITLGGLQGDVCDWLLQCQTGYKCLFQPAALNYSCSSICHFDYCHHHGICTHHPGQLPVCRCLVGEDFWFMGQRCDVRMTRGRLVGACLAILLIMVAVIGALAFVAVRRYRAALIQAKVDQTRSSYRRFNHFDELSGRFWLRSWAGSADSLDNPAFTRSDELLHLRALDRPCCYHDDTLSLASTCPSHGTRINTIYPHSSQYGWRGSEMSMGDGVLDSGKASDLSVCSWPVEPIQWTPFPLLQQLAANRTPTVRMSRPRSYCEGMELEDMGKSWTA